MTDGRVKERLYVYTVEYYAAVEKNEILPRVTMRTRVEDIRPSEVNHTGKDIHHFYAESKNKIKQRKKKR